MESKEEARPETKVPEETDSSDEEVVLCDLCEDDYLGLFDVHKDNHRDNSTGNKEEDVIRCAVCHARVIPGHVRVRVGRRYVKIRWADECKRELERHNPRKHYTKRPRQVPLKSILKGT